MQQPILAHCNAGRQYMHLISRCSSAKGRGGTGARGAVGGGRSTKAAAAAAAATAAAAASLSVQHRRRHPRPTRIAAQPNDNNNNSDPAAAAGTSSSAATGLLAAPSPPAAAWKWETSDDALYAYGALFAVLAIGALPALHTNKWAGERGSRVA